MNYKDIINEKDFWNKVEKISNCWIWKNQLNSKGYGLFFVTRRKIWGKAPKKFLAHRLAYEFVKGFIPTNLCVLHKCDNPPCVNPMHLFLGTLSENVLDAIKKGRWIQKFPRLQKVVSA